MAGVRPGQGFVPGGSLDALRLYLLKRSTGIDTAKPGVETVATTDAGAVTVATFGWTWAGSHREAPAPDGFVVWEEWTTSAAPSTPLLRSHYAPITARGHQTVVLPGFCVRVAVQTFRVQHERIEFGELVQSDEWVLDRTGDPLLSGGAASVAWGAITGTLSAQTDLQAALNAKLDDSQASAFGLTLLDDADAATARTTLGLGTAATQAATAFATAAQGALADSAWQPGDQLTTPDEVYDATGWNGNLEVPTKNAIRDKIESMSGTTQAPTNAPTSFALGSTMGIYSTVVISGGTVEQDLVGQAVELTWSYTQGASEADGFEITVDDGEFKDTKLVGKDARTTTVVVPNVAFVNCAIRAFRAGPTGHAFSSEATLLFAVTSESVNQSLGGELTWAEVTGTSQSAAVRNGYIANNASLVTVTLPATAAIGDTIKVVGKGAGKFRIQAATGDYIHLPWASTSAGGTCDAQERYASIRLICVTANSEWVAEPVGNFAVA